MAKHAEQILVCEKAVESAGPVAIIWDLDGSSVNPRDTLGVWEQIFEKLILAAEGHINMSTAHARRPARFKHTVDAVNDLPRLVRGDKFRKAVQSFPSGPFHNDVDGTALLGGNQASAATEELNHFLASEGVRDLYWNRVRATLRTVMIRTTYIGHFDHTSSRKTAHVHRAANRQLTRLDNLIEGPVCETRHRHRGWS